ncbi:hypothetical protein LEM8419_00258 [Neolewinella maritima]|uniref:Glycosyl transferase family 1 domain-containing protein n=1 Tax=Neolewinella maritima TaxID=1383882 RepID=A0ABM9AXI6_9BACT|nr:glycosyltransferase family 4 protein [Neolewinella maritima]CAH0998963.1 hypothetical protein LEM8419_00258 [Neolewinella maritima]
MKHITIFLDQYTHKNGGSATLIELGEALTQLGHRVNYVVNYFTVKSILVNFGRGIYPATFMDSNSGYSPKRLVKDTIKTFYSPSVGSVLRRSDYVIVPFVSPQRLARIKQSTKAKLVLNHAASVDMMTSIVQQNGHTYSAYCSLFDRVLFQSGADCKTSGLPNATTLRPSFREDKAANLGVSKVLSDQHVNIVWVGSLQTRKRPDLALDVVRKLLAYDYTYKLTLVGPHYDAAYAAGIREQALSLPPGTVEIAGFRENYLQYMSEADAIVQTSELEGVSRIIRESFFLGKVVATFNIQGTSEICTTDNAILVPFGHVDQLAEQVHAALTDTTVRQKLQANARLTYERDYSWDAYRAAAGKIFA